MRCSRQKQHDGTVQLAVQTCARFCVGIGGKRWSVFSTNATILPYIALKQRTVTPEAAGSSPVTPATN